MIQTCC